MELADGGIGAAGGLDGSVGAAGGRNWLSSDCDGDLSQYSTGT